MLSFRRPNMDFLGQNIEHNQVNTQCLTFARMNEAVNATNYIFSSYFLKMVTSKAIDFDDKRYEMPH